MTGDDYKAVTGCKSGSVRWTDLAFVLTRCPDCGYTLRGLPDLHRCPECGRAVDRVGYCVSASRRELPFIGGLGVIILLLSLDDWRSRSWDTTTLVCLGSFAATVAFYVLDKIRLCGRREYLLLDRLGLFWRIRGEDEVFLRWTEIESVQESPTRGGVQLSIRDSGSSYEIPGQFLPWWGRRGEVLKAIQVFHSRYSRGGAAWDRQFRARTNIDGADGGRTIGQS